MSRSDCFVGDVGTVYRIPTYDDDMTPSNFDPSSATTKQLIFEMPGASGVLTRTATAAQVTIDSVATWCLTYTVLAADVVAGGFHQQAGPVKIQGYLVFSASQSWKSSIVTQDQQGRTLRVAENL